MPNYAIQKWVGHGKADLYTPNHYQWTLAYGLNKRSWPDVAFDDEAIRIFKEETAQSRTSSFRLVAFRGQNNSTYLSVIATLNC